MSRSAKLLIAVAIVILFLPAAGYVGLRLFEPKLRAEIIRAIEEEFDSTAELQSLEITLFPAAKITGRKLNLWYRGRKDIPPLIQIDEFSASGQLNGIFRNPKRISQVNLKGLIIQIPPKNIQKAESAATQTSKNPPSQKPKDVQVSNKVTKIPPFVIARIHADGTILRILTSKPGKEPMIFEMTKLSLNSVGLNKPFQYQSTLKNPTPPGLITANGEFGPWSTKEPGQTPVSGIYLFREADLSVFKGISGTLSSKGEFRGVLERIDVNGTTDTPDFSVRTANHRVHLKTEFKAVVDGTSGDVLLRPVVAEFGRTKLLCEGGVIKKPNLKGKSVLLNVHLTEGRIEDVMKFAVPGQSPLVGKIQFKAKLDLPPGDIDVIQKLRLSGNFGVGNAEFTTPTVQQQIQTLSLRSRGKHEEVTDERIASDLKGSFNLGNGKASFSRLSFVVPGAQVQMEGDYLLASGKLDFEGTLTMQAKLSQTQKGIKSLLLKIVDPFFRKGKTTVVPIKITGTRKDPKFGLRLGSKKNKKDD